ncbi:MAG: leucine-rich repeat protein [Treponema sp.]|nr:leucine-rich repeat protein [Treponema sp.]
MKKTKFLIGIITMLAVIVLAFAACPNEPAAKPASKPLYTVYTWEEGDYDYELTITDPSAKAAVTAGTYVLFIFNKLTDEILISEGTASGTEGNFILQPDYTDAPIVTITITGNSIVVTSDEPIKAVRVNDTDGTKVEINITIEESTVTVGTTNTGSNACAHTWEWKVTTAVSATADGVITKTCSKCGAADGTQPIPMSGTPGLEFTLINDGKEYEVSAGDATSGVIVIPSVHNNKPVTTIADGSWDYDPPSGGFIKTEITGVIIPLSVTKIGGNAFEDCHNLTSINIHAGITDIGGTAFRNCKSLAVINVDPDNKHYKVVNGVLYNIEMTELILAQVTLSGNFTIPSTVEIIRDAAFRNCTGLVSVTIPNSVTGIERAAFEDCTSLTSITIPGSVEFIEDFVFENCPKLISITVDASNPNFSSQSGILYNKAKTEILHVPQAISGSITIPSSITEIGESIFKNRSGITSITIPNSVTSIGDYAFEHCIKLTSVVIPNSVTSIGKNAFGMPDHQFNPVDNPIPSALTDVTIGTGIKSIGVMAFISCYSLTSVTFNAVVPPTFENLVEDNGDSTRYSAFWGTPLSDEGLPGFDEAFIYVPSASVEAYKSIFNSDGRPDKFVAITP